MVKIFRARVVMMVGRFTLIELDFQSCLQGGGGSHIITIIIIVVINHAIVIVIVITDVLF